MRRIFQFRLRTLLILFVISAVAIPLLLKLSEPKEPEKYTFSLKRAQRWVQYLNCMVGDGESFSILAEDSTRQKGLLLVWTKDFSEDLDERERLIQDFEDWALANGIKYKLYDKYYYGEPRRRMPVQTE